MDDGCSESDDRGAVTSGSSSEEIPWALTIFSRHLGPTMQEEMPVGGRGGNSDSDSSDDGGGNAW